MKPNSINVALAAIADSLQQPYKMDEPGQESVQTLVQFQERVDQMRWNWLRQNLLIPPCLRVMPEDPLKDVLNSVDRVKYHLSLPMRKKGWSSLEAGDMAFKDTAIKRIIDQSIRSNYANYWDEADALVYVCDNLFWMKAAYIMQQTGWRSHFWFWSRLTNYLLKFTEQPNMEALASELGLKDWSYKELTEAALLHYSHVELQDKADELRQLAIDVEETSPSYRLRA